MKWIRTKDQLPPSGEPVLTCDEGSPPGFWAHGHYEATSGQWLMGCECLIADEPPDFWAFVPVPA